jgi:hypothetical protein
MENEMRFLVTYWPDLALMPPVPPDPSTPRDPRMAEYSRKSEEAGVLVSQGMFTPKATEISLSRGAFTTVERSGEAMGFAYLEAPSPAEAERHVREFLQVSGGGRTLIRQLA